MYAKEHPRHASQASERFEPKIERTPELPAIDWSRVGREKPELLDSPADELPESDVVVITWAAAEWAAAQHVFVSGDQPMPYSDRSRHSWPGWQRYDRDMPPYRDPEGQAWDHWGEYRQVGIEGQKVLLFKSNTHLVWPGRRELEALIGRLIERAKPSLLLSIGTSGGTRMRDHVGTVNLTNGGTYYQEGRPAREWKTYRNDWTPDWEIVSDPGFSQLLLQIPVTREDLASVAAQFNGFYGTRYALGDLDIDGLDFPDELPQLNDLASAGLSLVTTPTFVVANSSGEFSSYACIEMDDALIGEVCNQHETPFGFVRNISNPAQNAELPAKAQGDWGGAIYALYGLYTSYNGALATWATLAARGSGR